MSLLDQLSSLCLQSNYPTTFFSLSNNNNNQHNNQTRQQIRQNNHLPYDSIINKNNNNQPKRQLSQQKVIKLFDDEELKSNWTFGNYNKRPQSQQKLSLLNSLQQKQSLLNSLQSKVLSNNSQQNPSQSITQNISQKQDKQSLLINLTKMSYLFKNKLRKINYQFFVRLQNYSKLIKTQNQQQQKIYKQQLYTRIQCFINKLNDTIGVISLKYFHNNSTQRQQNKNQLCQAFGKIRNRSQLIKKLNKLITNCNKVIYKQFFYNLQQQNKKSIKIDLFYSLVNSIISKKLDENQLYFFKVLKQSILNTKKTEKTQSKLKIQETLQQLKPNTHQEKQYQLFLMPFKEYKKTQHFINLTQKNPLHLFLTSKVLKTSLNHQQSINFYRQKQKQNIPLKLHSLKTHDQQINLNDCVDNGHLLMTQMKANTSFRRQLQNLTISNINNKTNNSSLNSSFMGSENFILPQFNNNNNNDTTDRTQELSNTMRKSVNSQQKVKTATLIQTNPTKQPRKSLVITKRKQSMNQFNTYTNSLYNTQRQKADIINKKPKSTTNSSNKINQKQSITNDKQIIKKMLQQLNQKFQCHDKIINITLSNKKPTSSSAHKKQSIIINSSTKKHVQRKKVNSEFISTNNFTSNCVKNQKQSSLKQQMKKFNVTKNKNKNQSDQCDISICFMPVQLVQGQDLKTIKKQPTRNSNKPQEQRMKQSRSQVSKKNSNLLSQGSEDSEICKMLSKYRTKKTLFPQSNLKIDLLPNENNETLQSQKQANYYLGLSKPQSSNKNNDKSFLNDNKYKNSIFFRNSSLNNSTEHDVSLNTSQLSLITPKQSIRESFFKQKHSNPQLSTDRDSAIAQYISYLPQQNYFQQNQQENNSVHYTSLKPFDKKDTQQPTYYFETGSKKQLFKPTSSNSSLQKKRSSFDKNKDQWDLMFQKQKKKFLKNQQVPKMTKKKSLLNEEVISEIKNKIQQCFILSQKDQNSIKTDLTLKKNKNQSLQNEQKITTTTKNISQQSSKKNSLSKLYTTLNKLKRPQP